MRIILITGVSDGIGHALAIHYAATGARVLGVGRRAYPQSLTGYVAPADYCTADLATPDAAAVVGAFLHAHSVTHLDVLVHNAAAGWYGSPAQQSSDSIDHLLYTNLYAPIALTHLLLPWLRGVRGVVAFVSSIHSALPTADFAVYTATKAGLDGFARNLRIEEQGAVAVITLWPGPTRTQMHIKSGIPPERVKSARYADPASVARQMAAAIDRRRSRALGGTHQLLRWAATHFAAPIDALMARRPLSGQTTPVRSTPGHAVVTGAAEGIGRALAEVLAEHGYRVTGIDVNIDRAQQTASELATRGLEIAFLHGDLGDNADVERLTTALCDGPAIDIFVHNAGINCVGAFGRSELAKQEAVLNVNLRAPLHLTTALLHAGKITRGGSLVYISSLSRYVSYPGAAVYAASKDALASYARSLAVALAPQEIHVMAVYPGPTRTAHARRYSPDNRREARRMPPEQLAAALYRAIAQSDRRLIPGFGNKVFAVLGQWLPAPVEWVMKKTLFERR